MVCQMFWWLFVGCTSFIHPKIVSVGPFGLCEIVWFSFLFLAKLDENLILTIVVVFYCLKYSQKVSVLTNNVRFHCSWQSSVLTWTRPVEWVTISIWNGKLYSYETIPGVLLFWRGISFLLEGNPTAQAEDLVVDLGVSERFFNCLLQKRKKEKALQQVKYVLVFVSHQISVNKYD